MPGGATTNELLTVLSASSEARWHISQTNQRSSRFRGLCEKRKYNKHAFKDAAVTEAYQKFADIYNLQCEMRVRVMT